MRPYEASAACTWASVAPASRNPSSTSIAATLPPPSRAGDRGWLSSPVSRRWLTRIAREAGSPRTQARAAPLGTRLLRHGEAELGGDETSHHGTSRPTCFAG